MFIERYGWDQEKVKAFRHDLLTWYDTQKRDLPWRQTRDPYAIWISEIMLQQTQVVTVIPFYQRFMATLPNIQALAQVEEETLMTLWQGLGYYSRARNLKTAAQQIMQDFKGQMPDTMEGLLSLKGVGPYTAAAIGSMAFGLVEPAIDGNLLRVTARLFELDADISLPKSRKLFETILYELIDPVRPGDFNQAMMDLGARIMTPTNYYPVESPVKAYDASFINETAASYPVKSKKVKASHHYWLSLCIMDQDQQVIWVKHQEGQLLEGLWHFPLVPIEKNHAPGPAEILDFSRDLVQQIDERAQANLHLDQAWDMENIKPVKHIFTHRVWHIFPVLVHYQGVFAQGNQVDKLKSSRPSSTLQKKLIDATRRSYVTLT